jgi:hypothetical protein
MIANANRALFNVCVRQARAWGEAKRFEEALQWCSVATWATWGKGWFGELSSRELEMELLRAAQQLPQPVGAPGGRSRPRWLHVLSEAYETLGHTNLCRRWIQYDTTVTHDVILVAHNSEIPENLVATVKKAGGEFIVLDPMSSLLQRATDLRMHAWKNADVVVLHTHPDEILGTVAFGVEGGPPVLLMNHSDHVFWTGASVADMVLDIRKSGQLWTKHSRGINRTIILPVPLLERTYQENSESMRLQQKQTVRKALGIPEDATMLLTIASPAKYRPMPGLDFVAVAQEIVRACNNTYLIAVGPRDEGAWRRAAKTTGGRILAVGYESDSRVYCRAADVYLEGFPLGSLTSLLEAGQSGLPCVRAPADSAPPFSSDSLSLDGFPQPENVKDYIRTVVSLVKDPGARAEIGLQFQKAIESQHCGANWLARLGTLKNQIPERHRVHPDFNPAGVEDRWRDWWLAFKHSKEPAPDICTASTRVFIEAWKRTNARPRLDRHLWAELNECMPGNRRPLWSKSVVGRCLDGLLLWRLNKKIRSRGSWNKFMTAADAALRNNQSNLARTMVYRCIWVYPACWGDADWLKLFVKAHVGPRLTSAFRNIRASRARHFNGNPMSASL